MTMSCQGLWHKKALGQENPQNLSYLWWELGEGSKLKHSSDSGKMQVGQDFLKQ